MLNDISSPLALLQTRRSAKPRDLMGPSPSDDELAQILGVAARTPDHGNLAPWRFVVVGADQRGEFERLLLGALATGEPNALPAKQEKERGFAHYEGALVVLVSAPVANHKIPVWEQELSCGAAAMNLLLAAHALGYVGGWVTGARTYAEPVRRAFCADGERIAGFIFIGQPRFELEDRPRPELSSVATQWIPPALNV